METVCCKCGNPEKKLVACCPRGHVCYCEDCYDIDDDSMFYCPTCGEETYGNNLIIQLNSIRSGMFDLRKYANDLASGRKASFENNKSAEEEQKLERIRRHNANLSYLQHVLNREDTEDLI